MARFREAPCKHYMSEGECKKGRAGEYKTYCQHCDKYEARKGYVEKPNKKKEDRWKDHKENYDTDI